MNVLAIDPGTEQSAVVQWDGKSITNHGIVHNSTVLTILSTPHRADICLIEMVASYGMPVGREVFETCVWIGRFYETWLCPGRPEPVLVYRRDIKLHHCGSVKAKDSNIRQALIDKYGPPGTKKNPGTTYGLSKDLWQAFAIATYATEKECKSVEVTH